MQMLYICMCADIEIPHDKFESNHWYLSQDMSNH